MTEVRRARLHSTHGETNRLVTIGVNAPYNLKPDTLKQLLAEAIDYGRVASIQTVARLNHSTFTIVFVPYPAALEEPGGLLLCEEHIIGKYAAIVEELDVLARSDRLRAAMEV